MTLKNYLMLFTEAGVNLLGVVERDPAVLRNELLVKLLLVTIVFVLQLLIPFRGVRGVRNGSSILS